MRIRKPNIFKQASAGFLSFLLVLSMVSSAMPFFVSQVASAAAITNHVVINEVMATPATGELEWIELYNPTALAVNTTGWTVTFNNGATPYPVSATTIAAKGYVVVEAPDASSYLSDTTDTIGLRNAASASQDQLMYSGVAEGFTYARAFDAADIYFDAQASPTKSAANAAVPTDVYVDDDYSNSNDGGRLYGYDAFSTIQEGVGAVAAGGNVTVAAGAYTGSVNVNKPVTLMGSQAGVDARTRTIDAVSETRINSGTQTAFAIAANNVSIDGFQVAQAPGASAHAINMSANYSGISLVNNIVTRTTNGSAMHLYGGENMLVQYNYISATGANGVVLRNGNLVSATNQKIVDNNFDGIRAMTGGAVVVYGETDLEIARNDITTTFSGISIGATGPIHYNMSDIYVHSNTVNLVLDVTQPNAYRHALLIEGNNDNLNVQNNNFTQSGVTPTATTRYALIRVSYDGAPFAGVPVGANNLVDVFINKNNLVSDVTDRYALVGNSITGSVNATSNWWGNDTNPSSKITSANATVDYDPWLCEVYVGQANPHYSVGGTCDDITPPVVDAGFGPLNVYDAKTTQLDGYSDDSTATYKWTKISGPGTATFGDDESVGTSVAVSVYGEYIFKLTATDLSGNAASDEIEVRFIESSTGGSNSSGDAPTVSVAGAISPLQATTNASNFAASAASVFGTTTPSSTSTDKEEILGSQTTKKQSAKTPAVEATDNGWNIFGLAWYWWILILAALAGLVWFFLRRQNAEN